MGVHGRSAAELGVSGLRGLPDLLVRHLTAEPTGQLDDRLTKLNIRVRHINKNAQTRPSVHPAGRARSSAPPCSVYASPMTLPRLSISHRVSRTASPALNPAASRASSMPVTHPAMSCGTATSGLITADAPPDTKARTRPGIGD